MRRSHLALVAALSAAAMASCRDVPAPESGVLSVSPLLLPSPAVVVGDTMRDSVGAAAPLRLIAYGVDGEPVDPQPTPTFVVMDTGAHLAGTFLIGDATGTVRVIGSVSGLQTLSQVVLVTLRPDTLVPSDSTHQMRRFRFPEDTAATADLNVKVLNTDATPTGVDGVIVHYEITSAPPVVGTGPSVMLLAGNLPSSRDTTANSGTASRTLRLRLAGVDPTRTDSATVNATASYRGQPIGIVQFTIVFQPQ